MSIPVVTAVGDPRWEAELTAGLSREAPTVQVVRRCVDLADLLASAAAGLARAAILSGDLRRLDREALSRLDLAGVAVVGLVRSGDDAAEQRLRQIGVGQVLPQDARPEDVSVAVCAAVDALTRPPAGDPGLQWGGPGATVPAVPSKSVDPGESRSQPGEASVPAGRVVAVWGPAGAPGRTTIAVNLAAELATPDRPTLLIDADTYGGVVAQLLGLLDESPGIAAACRLANHSDVDPTRLADIAIEVRPGLSVLTGITRADRWLEIRPAALEVVLEAARRLSSYVVVDCGFCLEQDEELSYDTVAPRRNAATLVALAAADVVVAVAAADPVGLARYARALPDCAAIACAAPLTVVNRLRPEVTGPGDPRREVTASLRRYAGVDAVHVVPDDRRSLDTAMASGRTLAEAAPRSAAREAVRALAASISGEPGASRRHRRLASARRRAR
jgi:MinD-like ATPase involved in chromosome partitioning or flagellar assembly